MNISSLIDFKQVIEDKEVLSSYEGEITESQLNVILQSIEVKLESQDFNPKKTRKVYNILIEALQNLLHHTDKYPDRNIGDGKKVKSVAFALAHQDDDFYILCANYIQLENIHPLKQKIDKINSLDKDGLRDFYKETLDNGQFSVYGGGGLGIIDIARKSCHKLDYVFYDIDQEFGVFILKIKV